MHVMRWIILLTIIFVAVPVVAQEQQQITIAISASSGTEEVLIPAIERFSELHNVDVEVTLLPSGLDNRIDHLMVRYAGGVVIDVVYLNTRSGSVLYEAGMLQDLQPHIDRDPDVNLDDFIPATSEAYSSSDGAVYALPQTMVVRSPVVNLDIISASGLEHPNELRQSDWTWDNFEEYLNKVTLVNEDGSVKQMGVRWSDSLAHILISQAGGYLFDHQNNPTQSGLMLPETIQALETYVSWFHPNPIARRSGGIRDGDLAFSVTTSSSVLDMIRSDFSTFDWDVVRWPLGPDNNAHEPGVVGFGIFNNSQHPELAWELVKFLAIDEQIARDTTLHRGRPVSYIPNISAFMPEHWPDNSPVGIQIFQEHVVNPALSVRPSFSGFDDWYSHYRDLLRRAMEGEISVGELTEESDRQAKRILEEYGFVD